MRPLLLLVFAFACGAPTRPKTDIETVPTNAEPDPAPTTSTAPDTTVSVQPTSEPAGNNPSLRCLPLIGCGCFMQCSFGFWEMIEDGRGKVDYYDTMVAAKIEKHCIDGKCDEVFGAHTCAKQCTPSALPGRCEVDRSGPVLKCKLRPR